VGLIDKIKLDLNLVHALDAPPKHYHLRINTELGLLMAPTQGSDELQERGKIFYKLKDYDQALQSFTNVSEKRARFLNAA
jgi:hypothetical protein